MRKTLSFLLIVSFSWLLTLNNSALAECEVTGKENGTSCNYETCTPSECKSEICVDGACAEHEPE